MNRNRNSCSQNYNGLKEVKFNKTYSLNEQKRISQNLNEVILSSNFLKNRIQPLQQPKKKDKNKENELFYASDLVTKDNKNQKKKNNKSQMALKKQKWATTLLQPLNMSRGFVHRSQMSNRSHQRSIGSRGFSKSKKRSQRSKSNKSKKSQRSTKKSIRSTNKSMRSSRSQKSVPKNLYDKYGTNQLINGEEFTINNAQQFMCQTQRQESISKKRTKSTQNGAIKKSGGHKKSISVFSQENLPKSVFSAGSKNSRQKQVYDTNRPSLKKKISTKMTGPVSKKLISVKPSQILQGDSHNYLEQFEQFKQFQKFQQEIREKKKLKKETPSIAVKKKSKTKIKLNQNLLKTFEQQNIQPKTLKQMRKNIKQNSKEQLSSRNSGSNFNNKSINLQLLSEERSKQESVNNGQRASANAPNQSSSRMMIDLNQLQAELEENIDDSFQKRQKQNEINRFSNNLNMNNDTFTSQVEEQKKLDRSTGSNHLYSKINTKLKHKANLQTQRYNSHVGGGNDIEVLNNSKMEKLHTKDSLIEFASKSSIFNESGKHGGDQGSSKYSKSNKSITNTRKKNNYVQHTFGKAEEQHTTLQGKDDKQSNFQGSPVSALPLACGFVQQKCMMPMNECIQPAERKTYAPSIIKKSKISLNNSVQGKHFSSQDMQQLRPTKSKSSGGRYLEVLENFNQIEKRNSEVQQKPKRKPTKNITFYLRKDCKYQMSSRPLKVVNKSQHSDSLCQISEIVSHGHGRSTTMFNGESSQLQLSVDQDFPRSSKSQSHLQISQGIIHGSSENRGGGVNLDILSKSSREHDDLLEPSGDNDDPMFDLSGCLPACQLGNKLGGSRQIGGLNDTSNNFSTDSSQMLNQSRREKAAKRKQAILRRYMNNSGKNDKCCNPKGACNIFSQTQLNEREQNLSRGIVQASVDNNFSLIAGSAAEERSFYREQNGSVQFLRDQMGSGLNRTSPLTVQDIEPIHQSRMNIGTGSIGSVPDNVNLNTSTNNFGVRTGEKQQLQPVIIPAQPQNLINQSVNQENPVNLQQYKKASAETRNNNLFNKIVENAKQIPNMFDRQMIQNNFFNLQTNEIQIYSQHGSTNAKGNLHSPFIDIQKVVPVQTNNSLEKTAKQHQWKNTQNKTLNGMAMETPVISPCIISPVNPFVQPTSEKAVSEFKSNNMQQEQQNHNMQMSAGSKIMISAETGKFDQDKETEAFHEKSQSEHEEIKRNLNQEHYQHLLNIMLNLHLVQKHQQDYLNCPSVFLPKSRNNKVLILDVDETLIHTIDERDPASMKGSFELQIPEYDKSTKNISIKVNVRPYLMESLMQLKEYYQIIAFTASEESYANAVLDFIDPEGIIFDLRLYRQHCVNTEYGHIKDLRVIKNRMLKDILVLDNNCLSFAFNINNGVPILPFYDNAQDEELKHLTFYLSCIYEQDVLDVREHNQEAFGLLKLRDNHQKQTQDGKGGNSELEQFINDEKQVQVVTMQTLDKRSTTNEHMTTTKNSFQNSHHMASREYLQCDPVEIDEAEAEQPPSFHHQPGANQYPHNTNDIEIDSHEMKNESFYEHIDYDPDPHEDQSSYENRNDYIEVIEERPSEEDYTSMKKNPQTGRYEIRN